MADFEFYGSNILVGTHGKDTLTSQAANVVFGLNDDDQLESVRSTPGGEGAILNGGHGNDTYIINASVTQITDASGHDVIYLPAPESTYSAGFVDGRHLVLQNQWDGHSVLVMDYKGAGFIENFVDSQGTIIGGDQVQGAVYQLGWGDIALHEFMGGLASDTGYYRQLIASDIAIGNLNWNNVYQRLGSQDLTNQRAVAEAVHQELMATLSPQEGQTWEAAGGYQALLNSQFTSHQNAPVLGDIPREMIEKIGLLYEAALGRMPDQGGYDFWINTFAEGSPLQGIASAFMDAPEFQQQFASSSNAAFIDQLYLNVLDRPGEAGGVDYWLGVLENQSASQEDVLLAFAASAENIENAEWLAGLSYNAGSDSWIM
nr:DUF4214 domain-containing protein [uncultured Halomonas sp.]